jgi:hypothetical protein
MKKAVVQQIEDVFVESKKGKLTLNVPQNFRSYQLRTFILRNNAELKKLRLLTSKTTSDEQRDIESAECTVNSDRQADTGSSLQGSKE